jgi:hypothetical protein
MTSNSKNFCEELAALNIDDYLSSGPFGASDLELALYDLSDMMEGENLEDVLVDIFNFYEKHPAIEKGTPGPLVNLIERSSVDYIPALLASLESNPTYVTVNVLARVINGDIGDADKTLFIGIIDRVANNANANKFAIATAKEYLEHRVLKWDGAGVKV